MTILAVALNPSVDVSSDAARVLPTRKVRTHNQRRHAGGGGVNVARVVAMLGGRPQLLMMVGGETGALMMDALAGAAIDVTTVKTVEPTRLAFMVYEEETGLEYRFVPDGPAVTSEEIEAAMDVVRAFKGNYLVLSGSLPREAPDYTYARMAAVAASAGVKVVLDTSGKALLTTLKQAKLFLVKPSLSELETIAGKKLDERGIALTARQIIDVAARKPKVAGETVRSSGAFCHRCTSSSGFRIASPMCRIPSSQAIAAMVRLLRHGEDALHRTCRGCDGGVAVMWRRR